MSTVNNVNSIGRLVYQVQLLLGDEHGNAGCLESIYGVDNILRYGRSEPLVWLVE